MSIQVNQPQHYITTQQKNENISTRDAEMLEKIDEIKNQSIEHALWATAQSLALAKLKVFHAMAKSVNDQSN